MHSALPRQNSNEPHDIDNVKTLNAKTLNALVFKYLQQQHQAKIEQCLYLHANSITRLCS